MTIKKVASISGVSVRTLHHYDEIGLLSPKRNPENEYREYSEEDLDSLQQILFFKECGFKLSKIKSMMKNQSYNKEESYKLQRKYLLNEKQRIERMLDSLDKSILALKGEIVMTSEEKFDAFKEDLVHENEKKFGDEIRTLYGDDKIDKSNEQILKMSEQSYKKQSAMADEILEKLQQCLKTPEDNELAKETATLHRDWLKLMWGDSVDYTKEAHLSLIDTYMSDARFIEYYGGPQAVVFLKLTVDKYL